MSGVKMAQNWLSSRLASDNYTWSLLRTGIKRIITIWSENRELLERGERLLLLRWGVIGVFTFVSSPLIPSTLSSSCAQYV